MSLRPLLDEYLRDMEARVGLQPKTLDAYQSHITSFLTWLRGELGREPDPADLTSGFVQTYDTCLKRRSLAQSSRAAKLAAFRSFFHWLAKRGKIDRDVAANTADIKVRVTEKPKRRWATSTQVKALFAACESIPNHHGKMLAYRARLAPAMLACMAYAGLRRSEVCNLAVGDVVLDGESPHIIVRHGKGDKTRVVPLGSEAVSYLRAWIDDRPIEAPGLFTVPVCNPSDPDPKKRTVPHAVQMSENRLLTLIREMCRLAGIDSQPLAPHAFRRFAATTLLKVPGCGVHHVQSFLGHTDVRMTVHYLACDEAELRDLVRGFSLQGTPPAPAPSTSRRTDDRTPPDRSRRCSWRRAA